MNWLIALAINISAFWILTAHSWMQNPLGANFNDHSLRMELSDFTQLLHNPILCHKVLHTLAACYLVAAATILAISAWLLQKNPADQMAGRSFKLAAVLGLTATLAVSLGDSGTQAANPVQLRKQAAINGDDPSKLLPEISAHIHNGIKAYALLQTLRDENKDPQLLADFNSLKADLGYALLLQRWTEHVVEASDQQIALAAQSALPPQPWLLHWLYRFLIAAAIGSLLLNVSLAPGATGKLRLLMGCAENRPQAVDLISRHLKVQTDPRALAADFLKQTGEFARRTLKRGRDLSLKL